VEQADFSPDDELFFLGGLGMFDHARCAGDGIGQVDDLLPVEMYGQARSAPGSTHPAGLAPGRLGWSQGVEGPHQRTLMSGHKGHILVRCGVLPASPKAMPDKRFLSPLNVDSLRLGLPGMLRPCPEPKSTPCGRTSIIESGIFLPGILCGVA